MEDPQDEKERILEEIDECLTHSILIMEKYDKEMNELKKKVKLNIEKLKRLI